MNPNELLPRFDAFLAERGLRLEAIVVGGAALALMGLINRETRDFDLLEPGLTAELLEAAATFAGALKVEGEPLQEDWLNNGPASLAPLLPLNWRNRLVPIYEGQVIRLWTLGRQELLLSKLFALCDRAMDLADCLALRPSVEELALAGPWVAAQGQHPDWPAHVRATLADLAGRLGYGL